MLAAGRLFRYGLLLSLALCLPVPTTRADDNAVSNLRKRYYVVRLENAKVGHMLEKLDRIQTKTGDELRTFAGTKFEIKRGPISVNFSSSTTFYETPDGRPLRFVTRQSFGQEPVIRRGEFRQTAEGLVCNIAVEQAGKTLPSREVIIPEGALPPEALRRVLVPTRMKPGEQISVQAINPELEGELVAPTQILLVGKEAIQLYADFRRGWKVETVIDLPQLRDMKTIGWVDDDGDLLRQTIALGGLQMEVLAASSELAQAPNEQLELFASSFIEPNRTLSNPRALQSAEYILRLRRRLTELPNIPVTHMQQVELIDEGPDKPQAFRIWVRRREPTLSPGAEPDTLNRVYLQPSTMADATDERVMALAKRWRGDLTDPYDIAQRLTEQVRANIREKNLNVGFANASETARELAGDCTEHAVLLVATLRANGIPARGVTGLVYADSFADRDKPFFGYHMWTQAFVNGQWVDLDAALPGQVRPDATHIALGLVSLTDDAPLGELANGMIFIRNATLEIVSTSEDQAAR